MAVTYKVLGQVAPNANTVSNVYTVPAATQAVISTIIIVNRNNNANATYRIAVQPAGAALANQHYIAYDAPITSLEEGIKNALIKARNKNVTLKEYPNLNHLFSGM